MNLDLKHSKPLKSKTSGVRLGLRNYSLNKEKMLYYTSEMCNKCGCIDRASRKGNIYECTNCETVLHSDYNASKNIKNLYKLGIDSIPSVVKTLGQGQVKDPKAELLPMLKARFQRAEAKPSSLDDGN